jgi:UDP-glucose 4-epimerase
VNGTTDSNRTILVSGGAGYIGSHTVLALLAGGYKVVVLDDLSTGSRAALFDEAVFAEGNVTDRELVLSLIDKHEIRDAVHFAGSIRVEESVEKPLKYYDNNSSASRTFIESCVDGGIERFIFSSTAAAYGNPDAVPITEDAPLKPINPYGWSKVMTEQVLRDVQAVSEMSVGVLRYFNVAGADPEGRSGQRTVNATHLIKIACEVAAGKRGGMQIYGTDYPTPDGTCIRDYIHVSDLADAHVRVLDWLPDNPGFTVMNCGYGSGYSVREVLAAVEAVTGESLNAEDTPRRPGDPAELVADSSKLRELTGWTPKLDNLEAIVASALDWERGL